MTLNRPKHVRLRETFLFGVALLLVVNLPGAAAQDTPGSNVAGPEPAVVEEGLQPDASSEEIIVLPNNDVGDYKIPSMPPALCLDPIQAINEYDFLAALSTAFESAGLLPSLVHAVSSGQKLTILAPTNQAFANLVSELGLQSEQVLNDHEFIRSILQLHLVTETVEKDELKDGQELQTFNFGGVLTVSRADDTDSNKISVTLNDSMDTNAMLLNIDLNQNVCAGISILAIDTVLKPSGISLPSRPAAPVTSPFIGGGLFSPLARAQDGEDIDAAAASPTTSSVPAAAAAPGGLFGGMTPPGSPGGALPAFFGGPSSGTAATAPFTFPGAGAGGPFSASGTGGGPFTFPGTGGAGGFTFPTFGGASGATTGGAAAAAPGIAAAFPTFPGAGTGGLPGFDPAAFPGAGTGGLPGAGGAGGLPGFDPAAFPMFSGAPGAGFTMPGGIGAGTGTTGAGIPGFPGFPGMTGAGAAGTGMPGGTGSAFTMPSGFPGFPAAGGFPDAAGIPGLPAGFPGLPSGLAGVPGAGGGGIMGFPAGFSFPGAGVGGAAATGATAGIPLAPVGAAPAGGN